MTVWTEVTDGVFRQRYEPLDIGICVLRGSAGLVLVDTRSSHREADRIRADLAELGGVVRWVVNTHAHYDHTFGNARFGPGWAEVVITAPDVLVGDHARIDLGDRVVELSHFGRGHTDNDLVLHLPDAGVWLAGDLVEESGPPCYGSGSFPLDWPATIARLLGRVGTADVVVPGHGAVVDASFVAWQQVELTRAAEVVQELYGARVPVEQAVAAGGDRWPFPVDGMAGAVLDGYAQLAGVG